MATWETEVTVRLKSTLTADTVPGLLARRRQWRVSLKFRRGLLLESAGEALFVGGSDVSHGPYHLLLPRHQFELLHDWEVGRLVQSAGGRLESGTLVLESEAEAGYATKAVPLSAAGAEFGRNALQKFLRAEKMPTGLGFSARQMLDDPDAWPVSPDNLAADGSGVCLEKLVRHLVGRGPGLTPSGDDFLVGMMAVRPDWADLYAAVERQAMNEEATTTVSRCYFRQALRHCFDRHVILMITAMNHKWRKALRLALRRIRGHGHSSGLDLLAGALFALETGRRWETDFAGPLSVEVKYS
jgi:hypothetical protein